MTVTMVTTIDDESVLYEVYTGRAMDGDFNNGCQVWQKEVPFGMGQRFRAGGPAFVAAACEQAQIAESYALMPYEPATRAGRPDYGPESDTHEDRGYPPPRCDHKWGINGCEKCGQPAMPRG